MEKEVAAFRRVSLPRVSCSRTEGAVSFQEAPVGRQLCTLALIARCGRVMTLFPCSSESTGVYGQFTLLVKQCTNQSSR